jgi:hypothetical protein
MKTFVTVPIGVAPPRTIRQPRTVYCKIEAKRSLLRRFQQFIELTDWEKRYLCHERVDKVCLGIIAVSLIYFVPVLGSGILR